MLILIVMKSTSLGTYSSIGIRIQTVRKALTLYFFYLEMARILPWKKQALDMPIGVSKVMKYLIYMNTLTKKWKKLPRPTRWSSLMKKLSKACAPNLDNRFFSLYIYKYIIPISSIIITKTHLPWPWINSII